jgi:hypothetical protein
MRDNVIENMRIHAAELIDEGNHDPSLREIVGRWMGTEAASFDFILDEFRPALKGLLRSLREDGVTVFPMAQVFFDSGREMPQTIGDVASVTAIGYGKRGAGIHVVTNKASDPIYIWWMRQRNNQFASGAQKVADEMAGQVEDGVYTVDEALEILTAGTKPHSRVRLILGPMEDELLQIEAADEEEPPQIAAAS